MALKPNLLVTARKNTLYFESPLAATAALPASQTGVFSLPTVV